MTSTADDGGEMPTRSVIAREVRVHGTVQGVFFRASCVEEAQRAGVRGWVRNEPDGTVRARFEGAAASVEQMVRWCRQGPPRAEVTGVEATQVAPEGLEDFQQAGWDAPTWGR